MNQSIDIQSIDYGQNGNIRSGETRETILSFHEQGKVSMDLQETEDLQGGKCIENCRNEVDIDIE